MNKQLSMDDLERAADQADAEHSAIEARQEIEAAAQARESGSVRAEPIVQSAIIRLAEAGPERFDWGPSNPDIVIIEQPVTAIYTNPYGAVVIRQESRTGDNDDDPFVIFTRENLLALIHRLQEIEQGRP